MTPLIFVYIGDKLPKYFKSSLKHSLLHARVPIILLISHNLVNSIELNSANLKVYSIENFYVKDPYLEEYERSYFEDALFYTRTLERFFVIEQFVVKHNIQSFVHGEIDNLFFSLNLMLDRIQNFDGGIYLPRINDKYMIASILYCNSIQELSNFLKFVLNSRLLVNEMELLSIYQDDIDSKVYTLPTSINDAELINHNNKALTFKEIKLVFDASVIGHWLFGPDPSSRFGFVTNKFSNPNNKYVNPRDYKYIIDNENSQIMIQEHNLNLSSNLINIHVHSKIHNKIINNNRFLYIINRINNNRPSLISLNIKSLVKIRIYKYYFNRIISLITNR